MNGLTIRQLREELSSRGLSVGGTKRELQARLAFALELSALGITITGHADTDTATLIALPSSALTRLSKSNLWVSELCHSRVWRIKIINEFGADLYGDITNNNNSTTSKSGQSCEYAYGVLENARNTSTTYEQLYESVMYVSIDNNWPSMVARLVDSDSTTANKAVESFVNYAVRLCNIPIVTILLSSKQRIDLSCALDIAVRSGRANMVTYLLNKGANPNTIFNYGLSALTTAASMGWYDAARLLIFHGAKAKDHPMALEVAVEHGYDKIVRLLVESGTTNAQNNRALVDAAHYGHHTIVQILIEHGADVHFRNDYSLLLAEQYSHPIVVKVLVDAGASLKRRS